MKDKIMDLVFLLFNLVASFILIGVGVLIWKEVLK